VNDHWNKVWADARQRGASEEELTNLSWPSDKFGRLLELLICFRQLRFFLSQKLSRCMTSEGLTINILDLGCGSFTLHENDMLDRLFFPGVKYNYFGLDTSTEAIGLAYHRARQTGRFKFIYTKDVDPFEEDCLELKRLIKEEIEPRNTFVLTRRVLQNLDPRHYDRAAILKSLWGFFPAGCLIENTCEAVGFIRQLQEDCGVQQFISPSFNYPLRSFDVQELQRAYLKALFHGYSGTLHASYALNDYFCGTRVMQHVLLKDLTQKLYKATALDRDHIASVPYPAGPIVMRWCDADD
jgi:hypothetical protein